MKRAVLIIMTVAILGALGMYVQKKPGSSLVSSKTTASSVQMTAPGSGSPTSSPSASSPASYKDGTYQGSAANTPYGAVQIAIVVSGGRIAGVNFLQMPNDQGHSREVTAYAEPLLKLTTLQSQSAHIEFVSGATSTSYGYEQSLQAALNQAAGA